MVKVLRKVNDVRPKLSRGEQRALRAVLEGAVIRKYTDKGNRFMCGLIAPAVFHRLERRGYITDGATIVAGLSTTCRVRMTARGLEVFRAVTRYRSKRVDNA